MSFRIKNLLFLTVLLIGFIFFTEIVFAKDSNDLNVKADQSEFKKVNYELAYPGILPDNPLYKIKVLRDRIIGKLIRNPVKKIEYDLLLSDKNINAAKLLFDKSNLELAKETAYKGENYFTILVTDYKWTYWFGNKIPKELDEKIKNASLKHQEVIREMWTKSTDERKRYYQEILDFSKRNEQELVNLKINKSK